jgi:CubicO group peptidase (beta-lactamase class C family)
MCRRTVIAWLLTFALAATSPAVAQQTDAFHAELQPYVDRHELAGAVMLVADREKVLALESIGSADIGAGKAMPTDAVFWIASQSKPITAAAVLTLVDAGKIDLDADVAQYLPEFRGQMVQVESDEEHRLLRKPQRPIRVRDVLSHTSGLPFKSGLEEPTLDLYPLTARTRSYAMTPLDFEPGTKYQYSNAGINTAARIIEVVTGKTFEDYLQETFFTPLGMTDTTFWPSEAQAARVAKSYKPTADKMNLEETVVTQLYYPLTDRTQRFPMPAGGLFSTAHDVARFYQMLLNDGELDGRRYLSPTAVQELTKRQTPTDWKNSYGLGFQVSPTTFGHGGAYSTNTTADREHGLVLVWLVQHAGFVGDGAKCQEVFKSKAIEKFAQSR